MAHCVSRALLPDTLQHHVNNNMVSTSHSREAWHSDQSLVCCMAIHFFVSACLHHVAQTIALIVFRLVQVIKLLMGAIPNPQQTVPLHGLAVLIFQLGTTI